MVCQTRVKMKPALDILRRYARGEVDREEFERIKKIQ